MRDSVKYKATATIAAALVRIFMGASSAYSVKHKPQIEKTSLIIVPRWQGRSFSPDSSGM
jgi:hypothetical protein